MIPAILSHPIPPLHCSVAVWRYGCMVLLLHGTIAAWCYCYGAIAAWRYCCMALLLHGAIAALHGCLVTSRLP